MAINQVPIHSGFGATTTAREVIGDTDLSGKVAIVTGGYSGIGLETSRVLANAGATIVVPARSPDKARAALAGIPRVEHAELDLLDPASVDAFARSYLERDRPLHMLVNGAGIMAAPLARDGRGLESQFSANHLGHFQLAARLWPALCRADGARVVSVSSRAHRMAAVDFDDPQFERRAYDRWQAYGQSKSANALFAVALDQRGQEHGVRAFSLHPGTILTDLSRHLSDEEVHAFGVTRAQPERLPEGQSASEGGDFKTPEQGAATTVWCATSGQLDGTGGVYCENVDVAELARVGPAKGPGVHPWAVDPELAEKLWRMSEDLCGATLPTLHHNHSRGRLSRTP